MNVEVWKDIPGYEGRYQASTFGRIRSVDRKITQIGRYGTPFTRSMKGKLIAPGRYCESGHVSVVLGKGTNGKPVHQLILLTFLGPVPKGMEVRHLNGIPSDNRLENLVYGTRTENILDVYAIGRAWRILTADDVLEVRADIDRGDSGALIAKKFGMSQSNVSAIRNGVSYYWL